MIKFLLYKEYQIIVDIFPICAPNFSASKSMFSMQTGFYEDTLLCSMKVWFL